MRGSATATAAVTVSAVAAASAACTCGTAAAAGAVFRRSYWCASGRGRSASASAPASARLRLPLLPSLRLPAAAFVRHAHWHAHAPAFSEVLPKLPAVAASRARPAHPASGMGAVPLSRRPYLRPPARSLPLTDDQRALVHELSPLARLGDFLAVESRLAVLSTPGQPDWHVRLFNLLLLSYAVVGEWSRAEAAWARMPLLGVRPTAESYRTLFEVYTATEEDEHVGKIAPLYAVMCAGRRKDGLPQIRFSAADFRQLVYAARRAQLGALALAWGQHARAEGKWDELGLGCQRIIETLEHWDYDAQEECEEMTPEQDAVYRRIQQALQQARESGTQADEAVAHIISEAELEGAVAHIRWFRLWLQSLLAPGKWEVAERALAALESTSLTPDSSIYAALVEVYIADGSPDQLAKIDALYSRLRSDDSAGRRVRFILRDIEQILRTARRCGLAGEVRKWAARLEEEGLADKVSYMGKHIIRTVHTWEVGPSESEMARRTFVVELNQMAQKGDYAMAERAAEEWQGRGRPLHATIIAAWLQCYQQTGEWKRAEELWSRLPSLGVKPDCACYRSLMEVYLIAGARSPVHLAKIDPLYASMHQSRGTDGLPIAFMPSDYSRLLKTAFQLDMLDQVVKWGEQVRHAEFFTLIDHRSRQMLRWVEREQASSAPLRVQLQPLRRSGEWEEADRLVAEAESSGLEWHISVFNAWLRCYERKGRWQEAEKAWARMSHLQLQPDADSYCVLMCTYLNHGDPAQLPKVESLHDALRAQSVRLLPVHYGMLIRAASYARLFTEVMQWGKRAREAHVWDKLEAFTCRLVRRATHIVRNPREDAPASVHSAQADAEQPSEAMAAETGGASASASQDQAHPTPLASTSAQTTSTTSSVSVPAEPHVTEPALDTAAPAAGEAVSEPTLEAGSPSPTPTTVVTSAASSSAASSSSPASLPPLPASLSALTVADLRSQLKALGMKSSGLKAELVARLVEAHARGAAEQPQSNGHAEAHVMTDSEGAATQERSEGDDGAQQVEHVVPATSSVSDAAPVSSSVAGPSSSSTASPSSLSVSALKTRLKSMGLKVTGVKAELVQRCIEAQTAQGHTQHE